jgi:CHAD domain-containing protein
MKAVEEENAPALETATIEPPHAATPDAARIHRALMGLFRKRVKKFVALAPEVLAGTNPKAVHDTRVWGRRLEQAVSALFPKPRSGKVRRVRRTARRVRRMLGEWRNCDVLLEIVAQRRKRARSDLKQKAWDVVRGHLLQMRDRQMSRVGKKLPRQDLANCAAVAQKLISQPPLENPEILMQRLLASVEGARTKWHAARARARETRAVNDLHALRVATKGLRYRTELLYDLGHRQLRAQVKWLEHLQDTLGAWHDRQVLDQAIAEALARPELLLSELVAARILLAELEKDHSRESLDVEKIFRLAMEQPRQSEEELEDVKGED